MIIDKVVANKIKTKRKVNKSQPSLQKNGKLIKVKSPPSYPDKVDEAELSTDSFDNKVNKNSMVTSFRQLTLSLIIGPFEPDSTFDP